MTITRDPATTGEVTVLPPPPRRLVPERVAAAQVRVVMARSPRQQLARTSFLTVALLCVMMIASGSVLSGLQHRSSQVRAMSRLRQDLAQGTAPIGEAVDGRAVPPGTPIALLEIQTIGLREVVLQGTTAGVLMAGPGHRRGTPFPGQSGTSVVLGRRAAYGGPFRRLAGLKAGATITVTTGQGVSTYKVLGVRRAGDPTPTPLAAGAGRLQLVTASGSPFVPAGVLRVDADLASSPYGPTTIDSTPLSSAEQPLGLDSSTLWALVLWLQALLALALGAVWSWHRWGRPQTWIVFVPLLAVVALATTGQVFRLLPNLL